MAAEHTLNVDKVFYALGPMGRYQCLHLLLVSLGVFPALIQLLDNVFIGSAVDHSCARPEDNTSSPLLLTASPNHTLSYEECHIQVKDANDSVVEEFTCLHGFEYEGPRTQSVVSQLDLVCDKEQLLRVTQTLVFSGQAIGAIVGPYFSDRFGRKLTLVFSNLIMLVLGLTIAFAPNYTVFAIAKFFIGAAQQSVYIPVCIYTGELLPTEYRRYSLIINTVAWSLSGLTMSLVAFLMQDVSWRYLQAVLSLSSLVFIVHLW
ncbi:solute carrier family 22 member 8 [Plakobranchus ocellatus]|uniref:Solute carrier family 22 member 8 n=1 Tax=Plakobranchus ocellatus TaxID=259542 RepID=A0AAV3ZC63_9GAST|nr:solute carrier family 22 member 8 [Plakobranchus ocellatus]